MTISRREFTRLTAMGLAASATTSLSSFAQESGRKIGYCIIGLGRIADHHMRGIGASKSSTVTGLVSGHRDKAERIAAQYGVPKTSIYSYEDMDRMRDNKSIDAVINCLPNSMHAEYTIRSAKAGKHVLCEKPMSVSVKEAEDMIAACKSANVKLMIAYRMHYEPLTLKTIQLIKSGAMGKVQGVDSSNGFNIAKGEWRTNRALAGGGPMMDVGIYYLNAARYLTGEEPVAFTAVATSNKDDERFKDIEENLSWTMRFPSGIVASCSTTYGAQMPSYAKVFATNGWLEFNNFNYDGQQLKAVYRGSGGGPATKIDEASTLHDPSHFVDQVNHFTSCITENKQPGTPGEEGLRDIQYIDAIYKAAGVRLGTS